MIFRHFQYGIYHISFHQSKIRSTAYKINLRNLIYNSVKGIFKRYHQLAFLAFFLISSYTIQLLIIVYRIKHPKNNFGSLLQISINYADHISVCSLKPCINCSLLAEISAERKNLNTILLVFFI